MRKFMVAFFVLALMLGGISMPAYAADCTKDTLLNRFGDWFSTAGQKQKKKDLVRATRKANRIQRCTEEQAQEAAKAV